MKRYLAISLTGTLFGCAGMGAGGLEGMTAEQIGASSRIKDASVACIVANTPWGKTVSTFVNVDRTVVVNGSVTVDGDCRATFSNAPLPPKELPPK